MKKRFFFRNIGAILTFAFVGTIISTFTTAGIMYGVTRLFEHLSSKVTFLDTLRFGRYLLDHVYVPTCNCDTSKTVLVPFQFDFGHRSCHHFSHIYGFTRGCQSVRYGLRGISA